MNKREIICRLQLIAVRASLVLACLACHKVICLWLYNLSQWPLLSTPSRKPDNLATLSYYPPKTLVLLSCIALPLQGGLTLDTLVH